MEMDVLTQMQPFLGRPRVHTHPAATPAKQAAKLSDIRGFLFHFRNDSRTW